MVDENGGLIWDGEFEFLWVVVVVVVVVSLNSSGLICLEHQSFERKNHWKEVEEKRGLPKDMSCFSCMNPKFKDVLDYDEDMSPRSIDSSGSLLFFCYLFCFRCKDELFLYKVFGFDI